MNFFRKELDKELNPVGIKKLTPEIVYSKKRQTGNRIDFDADKKRTALPAGKTISKNGNFYYEYRKSRSDLKGLNI
jgi:hypothetical protein